MKRIVLLYLLFLTTFSCRQDSQEDVVDLATSLPKSEASVADSSLLNQKEKILALADTYELDSASNLLASVEFDKLVSGFPIGIYHYLDGYILDYKEEFSASITAYQKAIEVFEENGLATSLECGLAYNDLAYVYNEISLEAEALKNYKNAYDIIWKNHRNNPAEVARITNNYLGALAGYGNKKRIAEIIKLKDDYFANYLKNKSDFLPQNAIERFDLLSIYYLGVIKTFKVNFDEATLKKYLKNMEDLFRSFPEIDKANFQSRLIYAYDYAGYAYLKVKKFDEAKRVFDKMKQLASLRNDQMKAQSNFAALYLQSGDYANAERSYNIALQRTKFDNQDISYLMLQTAKAWMQSKQGKHDNAVTSIKKMWREYLPDRKALEKLKLQDIGSVNSTRWMFILNATAEIFRKNFEKNQSDEKQLQIAKNMAMLSAKMFQKYYEQEAFNAELSEINNVNREELLNNLALAKNENIEPELSLIENNTSVHLWKNFLAKNEEKLNVPQALIEKRNNLQIGRFSKDTTKFSAEKLAEIQNEIEANISRYEQNKYRPVSIVELQKKMPNEMSIIRYIHAEKSVFAVHITKNRVQLVRIGTVEKVDSLAQKHYVNLRTIDKSYTETARELYDVLLKNIPLSETKQLVIIAENSLQNIPFETLCTTPQKPLGLVLPIRYSYSLHFEDSPLENDRLFSRNRLVAFAPSYESTQKFDNLENTSKEIRQISDTFSGTLFEGKQATKSAFVKELSNYNIQHFAMHAAIDSVDYEESKLIFANNEALRFKEIYALNFPAELVTLSACNTGIGAYRSGEGLMSLSRALVYAGTHSVVHSLWRVPDEETAEIMGYFYGNLKKGMSKDAALKEAKASFVAANPLKQHPYFWAGFVLNGDAQPIKKSNGNNRNLLALIVVLVGVYIFVKRRVDSSRQTD